MFDIGWSELLIIGIVALIVIGPKELPGVLRGIGHWMTKIRRMASEFQGQFQDAMREAEMADLKKEVDEMAAQATDFGAFDPTESIGKDLDGAFDPMVATGPGATDTAATPAAAPPAPDAPRDAGDAAPLPPPDVPAGETAAPPARPDLEVATDAPAAGPPASDPGRRSA